ncbi:MAG: hypothetical protein HY706_09060, partial [Candidatus Hydrogenedentes bacterium]|nr:hypothetical protein [Candidatus Hydrogenedentota bacterium]
TPVGRAVRIKDSTTPTSQLVAFLDSQGNLYCQGYGFIGADPDAFEAETTITVGPPGYDYDCEYTDDEEPYDNEDPGSQAIQDAFTRAAVLGITYPVIVVYPRFENGVPVETVYNPFNFNGVDAVVQSVAPEDPIVVRATVLQAAQAYSQPVVQFGGSETRRAALKGFTIRFGKPGIAGNGTHAAVLNNIVQYNGYGTGYGGGLHNCDGLIQMNIIEWNQQYYGGGLAYCDGTITNNIIRYNEATVAGGGLYGSTDPNPTPSTDYPEIIAGNLIYCNRAAGWSGCGGALADMGVPIQNNLIFYNSAYVNGGGLYQCTSHIEHNTVYHNVAASGGGVHSCTGTGQVIRSNIIWANTPNQILNSTAPEFSCIQGWSIYDQNGDGYDDLNGNTNQDPRFVTTAQGSLFREFLHISCTSACDSQADASPCIDRGYKLGPKSAVATLHRDHRDIDDQPTYVDITGIGSELFEDPDPDPTDDSVLPYDMGADEYPSPEEFAYWWELLGESVVTIYVPFCPGCN